MRLRGLREPFDNPDYIFELKHEGCGKKFFEEICGRDLEGIVANRKLSAYKDDANGWLKIKNRAYSQAQGRNEMMFPPKHPES
jgi:ATP-dependent DNA ligase